MPLKRTGAEPYFDSHLAPPQHSWVASGFPMETRLTRAHAPFAYFAHATYHSFAAIKTISFSLERIRFGARDFKVNAATSSKSLYHIHFANPPQSFEVDGEWRPPFPPSLTQRRPPTEVGNVLGIWWAEPFPMAPHHIGVVVSDETSLKNIAF
ncbi:hypothetical protein PRK78_006965 [Emydomyces testavorans]|uniref:Uncharacterized protein n=1 Tax=Emydomyces testavorans TaxID=2070801 RepID=A0AAF0DR66_9EURO|nr:hypothetical protein PRK78_006965 [Emydomyces testavorans]